jgi:hypothetical protein
MVGLEQKYNCRQRGSGLCTSCTSLHSLTLAKGGVAKVLSAWQHILASDAASATHLSVEIPGCIFHVYHAGSLRSKLGGAWFSPFLSI